MINKKNLMGISSIASETKILVEKNGVLKADCSLDVHGLIKGNVNATDVKIGPNGKIDGNLTIYKQL